MKRTTLAAALLSCLASFAASAATPIDETRPLRADGKLSLENVKGRIVVTVWDRAEVHITGSLGEGTEGLQVEGDAGDLRVAVKYPENNSWFGGRGNSSDSDLLVSAPATVALDIEAVSASVEVRGARGARLEIDNVSGDVTVDAAPGAAEFNTVSGDLDLTLTTGDLSAESVSGDVEIRGAVDGRIELEAVSGSLHLDSSGAAKSLSAGVVSGDVELRTGLHPGGRLSAESLSGNLEVILPASTSAQISASSFTGTISSFTGQVDTEEHGPGSSLEVKLGNGDGRIDLETFSGDLTIKSD